MQQGHIDGHFFCKQERGAALSGIQGQAEPDRAVADEIEMCLGAFGREGRAQASCPFFYWSWARSMRFVLTGFIQAADSFLQNLAGCGEILVLPLHWGWGQII